MPQSNNKTGETALPILMGASTLATEHRLAQLHVLIGIFGCTISYFLVAADMLPLIMPGWLYLSGLFFFLIYAVIYLAWSPYRKYDLRVTAGILTILDMATATLIILNTGGLLSTFWGLWAAVVLAFIIRFQFSWRNGVIVFLLFCLTMLAAALSMPEVSGLGISLHGAIVGIAFSLMAIILTGYILVHREREAIRLGMKLESEAIHRLVNTVQHEVNNPLTVASGNLMLLHGDSSKEDRDAKLQKIEIALERIGMAIEQLRELEEERIVSGIGVVERYPLREERTSTNQNSSSTDST